MDGSFEKGGFLMIRFGFSVKSSLCVLSALLSLLIFTPKADAALYLYSIPSTNFTSGGGGNLSGSFVWDQISTLSSVSLTTTAAAGSSGGTPFQNTTYTSGTVSGSVITLVSAVGTLSINFNGVPTPKTLLTASELQPGKNKGDPRGLTFGAVTITLVPVPEPSTYAILAGGLALATIAAATRKKATSVR